MAATSRKEHLSGTNADMGGGEKVTFFWVAGTGLACVTAVFVASQWSPVAPLTILVWIAAALLADLLVVQFDRGFTFSMSLPVTLAAAMILGPAAGAVVAFLGSADPLHAPGRPGLARALFNRSQVACATAAAGLVFAAFGTSAVVWPQVLPAAVLALAADCAVNAVWTILAVRSHDPSLGFRGAVALFGSVPTRGAVIYLVVGLYAPVLALLTMEAGLLGLVLGMAPLVVARDALASSEWIAMTTHRLTNKDRAIRDSLDTVANERREERQALAGALHDDVLPVLFKVHLMAQVIRHDLASGKLLQLDDDVPELLEATETAQEAIRGVVAGLRTSAIGPKGLESAVRAVADRIAALGGPKVEIDVDVDSPESAGLTAAFNIAREAMMNAAKHARASLIRVRGWASDGSVYVVVEDDGVGFDPTIAGPEGHFGLELMRERIEAVGGRLDIESLLGRGTTVRVNVPVPNP